MASARERRELSRKLVEANELARSLNVVVVVQFAAVSISSSSSQRAHSESLDGDRLDMIAWRLGTGELFFAPCPSVCRGEDSMILNLVADLRLIASSIIRPSSKLETSVGLFIGSGNVGGSDGSRNPLISCHEGFWTIPPWVE